MQPQRNTSQLSGGAMWSWWVGLSHMQLKNLESFHMYLSVQWSTIVLVIRSSEKNIFQCLFRRWNWKVDPKYKRKKLIMGNNHTWKQLLKQSFDQLVMTISTCSGLYEKIQSWLKFSSYSICFQFGNSFSYKYGKEGPYLSWD